MLRGFLIVAIFLAATPAFAGMPPKEYDRPYAGKLTEHVVQFGKADALCRKIAKRWQIKPSGFAKFGCAYYDNDRSRCEIVISYDPKGWDKKMKSNVRRHELGHCNGWPSSHPNALP